VNWGKRENVKKGIQNFFMMAIGKNIPKAILLLLSSFNNQKTPDHSCARRSEPTKKKTKNRCCVVEEQANQKRDKDLLLSSCNMSQCACRSVHQSGAIAT
jgi:hypothetical protein